MSINYLKYSGCTCYFYASHRHISIDIAGPKLCLFKHSFKLNELIQCSPAGVYVFFNPTSSKNTSV